LENSRKISAPRTELAHPSILGAKRRKINISVSDILAFLQFLEGEINKNWREAPEKITQNNRSLGFSAI